MSDTRCHWERHCNLGKLILVQCLDYGNCMWYLFWAKSYMMHIKLGFVQNIVDSVAEYGEIVRPYLGVRYIEINEDLQQRNNLTVDYGVLIIRGQQPGDLAVIPGSPADKAGIVENDIILEFDGKKLTEKYNLSKAVSKKEVGDEVKLKVRSKGEEKEVVVKLEERE